MKNKIAIIILSILLAVSTAFAIAKTIALKEKSDSYIRALAELVIEKQKSNDLDVMLGTLDGLFVRYDEMVADDWEWEQYNLYSLNDEEWGARIDSWNEDYNYIIDEYKQLVEDYDNLIK